MERDRGERGERGDRDRDGEGPALSRKGDIGSSPFFDARDRDREREHHLGGVMKLPTRSVSPHYLPR